METRDRTTHPDGATGRQGDGEAEELGRRPQSGPALLGAPMSGRERIAPSPRLLARWVAAAEPLIVLALAFVLWFPRPASPLLLFVFPLLWLVRRAAWGRLSVPTPYDGPVFCLLLFLPLAFLPVTDESLAAPKLYGILAGIALVYALANALATRRAALFAVYAAIIALGGALTILGLVGTERIVHKLSVLAPLSERLPVLLRGVTGGTEQGFHPNEVGGAITLLLPLALAPALAAAGTGNGYGRRALRGAFAVIALVMGLALFLTQSRSAYAGALAGLGFVLGWWLVALRRTARGRALGAAALALFAGGAAYAVWRLAATWAEARASGLDSLPSRAELWTRAIYMLQDFPYTGIGLGQFPLVLGKLYPPFLIPPDKYPPHAHNFFLQLGLDLGVPGAVAVLFLIGAFFRELAAVYRRTPEPAVRAAAVGLAGGVAGFLVFGLTDAIALGARGAIVLWLLLGLGAALARAGRKEAARRADRRGGCIV